MEMQADEPHVLQLAGALDDRDHVVHRNAKLILRQPRRDVGMRMSAHLGIDAEADIGYLSFFPCQFVDHLKLGNALDIEAEDVSVERRVDLPIGFPHTCKHNAVMAKAGFHGSLYLSPAHAVGTETGLSNDLQNLRIGIGLDGIVNDEVGVLRRFFLHLVQRLSEKC